MSISTVLVSLVHIVVVGLLSLGSEKQSMSGLPERSVVAYCFYAERAKWNALMVGMSAKQVLAEQQLKGAELKVENTELSCGGIQRTSVVRK